MKIRAFMQGGLVIAMLAVIAARTDAATLQGQVTSATTGEPLTGAAVTVDAEPADGTPEFETVTDLFGFYEIRDVPAAAQRLRAALGGHTPVERAVVVAGLTMNENFALTPLPGVTPVEIHVEVADAASNWKIPDIPVEIIRYDSATDLTPDPPVTVKTDATGNFSFYGITAGYYTFAFNTGAQRRPGWESYPKAGGHTAKMAVSSPHLAGLMLKHVPQTIKLRVEGMDPTTEQNGPLKNMVVELTGVSPDDHELVLIPPREMATDDAGEVSFHNLAPIHWRARIKRPGYELTDTFLEPAAVTDDLPGRQPGAAEVLQAVIEPTALLLTLKSAYDTNEFYEGIEVRLDGVAQTNAEGIRRQLDAGVTPEERLFSNLLPGRYEVRVSDRFEPDDPLTTPAPHFTAEETVELVDGLTTEEELLLEVRRAIVRARLFKADSMGEMTTGGGNDFVLRRPIYQPHEAEVLMGMDGDHVTGGADENGDLVFVVNPGLYGFAVPSMTDYLGSHILVQHDMAVDPRRQGWPVISGASSSPAPPDAALGDPLVINSDREYRIDLYAHKKGTTLALDVVLTGDNPTQDIVTSIPVPFSAPQTAKFVELLAVPPVFEITEAGSSQTITGSLLSRGGRLVVEFANVMPGTWTWTGTHPRFDIEAFPLLPGSTPETVTLPGLPEYPGANYPAGGPPGAFFFYNPVLMYQTWPTGVPADAAYKASPPMTLRRKVWDEELDPPQYVDAGTDSAPHFDFIRPAYAGGALFAAARRPLGSFDFWKRDPSGLWFAGSAGTGPEDLTIFVGGPSNNVTPHPPVMTAAITLKAVSREAPDVEIPGIKFNLGGSIFDAGSISVPGQYTGPLTLTTATDPAGVWLYKRHGVITSGVFNNAVLIVAEMGRALNLSGTVKVDNAAAEPIPGAKIRLRDRFGDARFPAKVTDDNGAFVMPSTLETPAFFVDVSAPGFKPRRLRFGGADPAIGLNGSLVLDLRLEPLPAPAVEAEINRYGLFLSNVSFSSKGPLGELGRAVDELTATWTATATPAAEINFEELNFDNADGTPGGSTQRTLKDGIALVAIVDPRLFPRESSDAAGTGGEGAGEEGMFDYMPDPDPAKVLARRAWWDTITTQSYKDGTGTPLEGFHIISRIATSMMTDPMTHVTTASGQLKLWTLPPGRFSPVIVVETKHGALSFHQITYTEADSAKTLRALRPPAWMAAIADAMALTKKFAGSPLLQRRALDKHMSGKFKPKRITNGVISVGLPGRPEEGYLKYAYNGNTQWNEGQSVSAEGFLGMVTDTIGGALEVALDVVVDGTDGSVLFEARGTATPDAVDASLFKPARLTERQKQRIKQKRHFIGSASFSNTGIFDPEAEPLELLTKSRFLFGAAIETRYDLKPHIKLIPKVGPLFRVADRLSGKKFQVDALARAAAGFDVVSTWTTRRPQIVAAGSGVPGSFSHPEKGHYLGGREVVQPGVPATAFSQSTSLLFHLGIGIEAAIGELAGASVNLSLQGSKVKIPIAEGEDLPALQLTFNPDGYWPVFKEVRGEIRATFQAFADLVLTRLEKISFFDIPFSYQFSTESRFDLVPLSVTFTSRSLADEPPATWLGASPQLARGILLSARDTHRIAAGTPDLMVFPDIDPMTGRMLLRAAVRVNETTWGTPVTLGDEDGIVAADAARLSNGTLLAVWTSIAAADLASPGAGSTIRFSTSTNGGVTWSAPATAAVLAGVADTLHLETSGTFNSLVYLMREGFPGSPLQSISGMTYSTVSGWSAPATLAASQEILSLDAAGVSGGVTVAFTNAADELKVFSWSGGAPGAIATNTTPVNPGVAVIESGGLAVILSLPQAGGIQTRSFFFGSLLAGPLVYADETPDGISGAAVGGSPGRILIAWTDGPAGALRYALLNAGTFAAVSQEPLEVTRNSVGRYTLADVVQSPSGHATVFTRFHAPGAQPELRQFIISRTDGLVFTDRDGDGINDIDELLIVDTDPNDDIHTIDDVTSGPGGSDFDGDGVSDADEIAAGTDPADPRSRPLPPGVNLSVTAPTAQEFGLIPGQFQITRSDATQAVDVLFSISGTATEGDDYLLNAASPLHFEADQATLSVDVLPLADSLPEGAETIILTLLPDAAYTLGAQTSGMVTLHDRPSDAWLRVHFPGNPESVSFDGDTDGDGISEAMEFGLALDPNNAQVGGLPIAGRTADGNFITLRYTRPIESDLFYTVQVSDDGVIWRSGGLHTTEVSREHHDNGTETVTVRGNTPFGAVPRQLMRLEVRRE
ncbi:MAG TPA: hypothetical protein DIT64_15185 [Verrucomicrobiales bacterium]|nr:hypothetical protein [Verrucomicrobiales bacterium]